MNAPPDVPPPMPRGGTAGRSAGGAAEQWAALNEAGDMVAVLCGLNPGPISADIRDFPTAFRNFHGVRRDMAENGIADLMAMMEPGIAALLAIRATGGDPAPAAATLWQEFESARAAIIALRPPGEQAPQ